MDGPLKTTGAGTEPAPVRTRRGARLVRESPDDFRVFYNILIAHEGGRIDGETMLGHFTDGRMPLSDEPADIEEGRYVLVGNTPDQIHLFGEPGIDQATAPVVCLYVDEGFTSEARVREMITTQEVQCHALGVIERAGDGREPA